ncbi:MAG: flagellar biosynthesis protein FliQ [Candidatus Eisenbacteria bacterium]|nr:flagellar biosynthesis protein FliQ [Candidatus Eisenbacteria bacterium]
MTEAVELFQRTLWLGLLVAAPMLLFGLVTGLLVSILQAVTQVQELTLTFIPKILAVALALILFLPWMVHKLVDYTVALFNSLGGPL